MAYRLYRFGATTLLPLGDPQDDVAGAEVPSDAVAVAGGSVHYAYGASSIIPVRRHTINHRGIYSSDVENSVDEILAMVGQRAQLWRIRASDSSLQWKYAKLLSGRWQRDKEQSQHAVVDLKFDAKGNWRESGYSSANRTGTGSVTVGSTDGDAWCFFGNVMRYTASSTGTHTLRVQNTPRVIDWQWSGTMTSGHVLVVDSDTWTVTNNGADAYSGFTINAGHGCQRLMVWAPTTHTVTFTLSAGSGSVVFEWYDQWI